MRQLVYRSIAAVPFDRDRLLALLQSARRFNEVQGITGVLLLHSGMFAQCLEGPVKRIAGVWKRISRDPSHRDLSVLQDMRVRQRSFDSWSMACSEVSGSEWQMLEAGSWLSGEDQLSTPGLVVM